MSFQILETFAFQARFAVHALAQSGVDFLTGGVLKWLCGGPGGCFLYVSPSIRDSLAPALTGWQAHARPFAFETEMEYAE